MSIRNGIGIILGCILGLASIGFLYQKIGEYQDKKKFPAPGMLADIGGYKLHYHEAGTGQPTVVFDAGTGSYANMWYQVPSEVAQFAHAISYDKAGLGWSDESPLPRTSRTMVTELHELLEKIGVQKPFIMVGHSLGGGTAQLYANTYPDDVYGLVLVDAGYERVPEMMRTTGITFKRVMTGFTAVDATTPPTKEDDGLCFSQRAFIALTSTAWGDKLITLLGIKRLFLHWFFSKPGNAPYELSPAMLSRTVRASTFPTTTQEIMHYGESACQVAVSENHLADKPMIVIANGKGFFYNALDHQEQTPTEIRFQKEIWQPAQEALAKKSNRSELIIAQQSGHRIQDTEPELIVNAIKQLVDAYRNEKAAQ